MLGTPPDPDMNTPRSHTLLAIALFGLAACSSTREESANLSTDNGLFEQNNSINPDGSFKQDLRFEDMLQAVASTQFGPELTSGSPMTVLAVTDDALKGFSGEQPMNGQDLNNLVGIHLIPGDFDSEALASQTFVTTLGGQRLTVHDWNGRIELQSEGQMGNRSTPIQLVETDLSFGPLRIHVLERPLEANGETLGEMLNASGSFTRLLTAIETAGLGNILDQPGPFTVFAPSDAAMSQLESKTIAALKNPKNRQQLVNLLQRHVISGRFYSDDFHVTELRTSSNESLKLGWNKGAFELNGARFLARDMEASNGVLHVIDRLLVD